MVKISEMEKDIKSIAEKVGTAVFFYNEIHNSNIDTKYKYDYQRVIDEVSRIHGRDMTDELVDKGILSALPDGEYKVNVGESTEGGGGINYHGTAFFSYNKMDYETHYHELAHSLQKHYNLFNDELVDELYEKSGNGLSEEEKNKKLSDRVIYKLYLNEMHSESFSYAAKMLRAENWWDFTKEAIKAYNKSVDRNNSGFKDKRKTYGGGKTSLKYYSSYPVIKETIKQIYNIRKQKKLGEYFDENGVINDEKLAKLTENIVKEKGYSPRTLKSYFDYKYFDGHKKDEHGWRRDTLKTLVIMLPVSVVEATRELKSETKKVRKMFVETYNNHKKLINKEKDMINDFLNAPISSNKNIEDAALEAYQKIKIKLSLMDNKYEDSYIGYNLGEVLSQANKKGGFPPSYVNNFCNLRKDVDKNDLLDTFSYIDKIIKENKNNPYFEALINTAPDGHNVNKMINERKKDENKNVVSLSYVSPYKTAGYRNFPAKTMVKTVVDFSEKFNIDEKLRDEILKKMVKTPEEFQNAEFRKELFDKIKPKRDFLGYKTKKLKKGFNQMMDGVSSEFFKIEGNDYYETPLKYLQDVRPSKMLNVIEERLSKERKGIDVYLDIQSDPIIFNNFAELNGKIDEMKGKNDAIGLSYLLTSIANGRDLSFELKNKLFNVIEGSLDEISDCSKNVNFQKYSAYCMAKICQNLKQSDEIDGKDKEKLLKFCSDNMIFSYTKNAFDSVYEGKINADSFSLPSKEEVAIEKHLKFLEKKEELLEKYPEISNFESIIDDSYRYAIVNKSIQQKTFNIECEGRLPAEFYADWKKFNSMLLDEAYTEKKDGCLSKLVGKNKEETLLLEDLKKSNPSNKVLSDDNNIEYDNEYKAIYGKLMYEALKKDMVEKYPDIIDMNVVLDTLEKHVFDNENGSDLSISYHAKDFLDDKTKEGFEKDFNEIMKIATELKNNENYEKVKDIDTDDLSKIYDEKRKNPDKELDEAIYKKMSKSSDIELEEPVVEETSKSPDVEFEEPVVEEISKSSDVEFDEQVIEEISKSPDDELEEPIIEEIKEEVIESNENIEKEEFSFENIGNLHEDEVVDSMSKSENITEISDNDNRNSEEVFIDEIIKKGTFSKEEEDELLDLAISVEKNRLENIDNNGDSYSKVFIDKVFESDNISNSNKAELFEDAIKIENKEIEQTENSKRLYFDKDKIGKLDKLNLSDEIKEALDIKVEDSKFSIKIPEDNNMKKEIINSIKEFNNVENKKSKSDDNSITLNMAKFMANRHDR